MRFYGIQPAWGAWAEMLRMAREEMHASSERVGMNMFTEEDDEMECSEGMAV
jgi:hypothetical protein